MSEALSSSIVEVDIASISGDNNAYQVSPTGKTHTHPLLLHGVFRILL